MSGSSSADDPAIPGRDDQLAVDEVAEALEDRPLTRLGAIPDEVTGVGEEGPDRGRRRGLDLRRVVGPEEGQDEPLVLARARDGIDGAVTGVLPQSTGWRWWR